MDQIKGALGKNGTKHLSANKIMPIEWIQENLPSQKNIWRIADNITSGLLVKHIILFIIENTAPGGKAEDEEYEEEDEPDRLKFSEHLTSIGVIGREVTEHALPTLSR